ncbi:hypothetical protein BKA80DRAFT_267676 [Phyllosticta citrichinensis]
MPSSPYLHPTACRLHFQFCQQRAATGSSTDQDPRRLARLFSEPLHLLRSQLDPRRIQPSTWDSNSLHPRTTMSPEQNTPGPRRRTRGLTNPSPFLRPYRRMPTPQVPPRPATSPAALPTGRLRGDRDSRRLRSGNPSPESITTTTTRPPGHTGIETGYCTYAEGKEEEPRGFTTPSPVSPPTDSIDCTQSDCIYECTPLEPPFSYFPTPPPPSNHCPRHHHRNRRLNSHTRSISDGAVPSDLPKLPSTSPLDWTPRPLPVRIARPPGHPPARDAIFAPPATPYPLALASVTVVASPWTGASSSSSSSPTSLRSNKSSGSGSPIDWSPFHASAPKNARGGEGEVGRLWGRSLPWGLRVPSGLTSPSRLTGGREGSGACGVLMPLRAAPPPPSLPSRILPRTQPRAAAGPVHPASSQPPGNEHQGSQGPSLLTQILNARVWVAATSRVFGPTDPRTVAARKEESARRVERANWVERIEASLGRTKGLRDWWSGRGHGRGGANSQDRKRVRFVEENGEGDEKTQVSDGKER